MGAERSAPGTGPAGPVKIAPSLLSADFARLGEEADRVAAAGADWLHVDVMDGHFVPNITAGPVIVQSLRRRTRLPLDVHLMVTHPGQFIEAFATAGSDWLTIHTEIEGVGPVLDRIKALGVRAGVAIKPGTPVADVRPWLDRVDLVLVMSVEPGFGGQAFLEVAVPKVRELRAIYRGEIAVDGGITDQTAPRVVAAGASVLVAGNYVFGARDVAAAIRMLRAADRPPGKR